MAETSAYQQDPTTTTLAEAKDWLAEQSKKTKGAYCPCCAKAHRTYGRKITSVQAAVLVLLHQAYSVGTVIHIQNFVVGLGNTELMRGREWGRLVHWDLIESTANKGEYLLCQGGAWFIDGTMPITEKAWIRDNVCLGFEGKNVTIAEALGKKFDLNELMAGTLPTVKPAVA